MPGHTTTRTAVVVGSSGIIGRAIAAKLAELGGWRVLGVTRSGGAVPGVDEAISADLSEPGEARRGLAQAAGATHLFYAGYVPLAGWAAEVVPNLALLVNAVEGLEAVGAPLQHVTLITRGQVLRGAPWPVRGACRGDRAAAPRPELLLRSVCH